MRVLGIDWNNKSAIGVLVSENSTEVIFNHKVSGDAYNSSEMAEIAQVVEDNINKADSVAMKKGADKGKFAVGPYTFKLQAIVQLACHNNNIPLEMNAPQTIATTAKKLRYEIPEELRKYMHDAYKTARTSVFKGTGV